MIRASAHVSPAGEAAARHHHNQQSGHQMTEQSASFGAMTVHILPIGFRFTRKGEPGRGQSREWLVTSPDQLEDMELRARAMRSPDAGDLLSAIKWAVAQIKAGVVAGMELQR